MLTSVIPAAQGLEAIAVIDPAETDKIHNFLFDDSLYFVLFYTLCFLTKRAYLTYKRHYVTWFSQQLLG